MMIRKFLDMLLGRPQFSDALPFADDPTWLLSNDFEDQRARIHNASAALQAVLLSVSSVGIGICHWQQTPLLNIQMPLSIARVLASVLNDDWMLNGSFDSNGEVTRWYLKLNSVALNHLNKDEAYDQLRKRINVIAHAFRIALYNQNITFLSNDSTRDETI